MTKLEQKLIKLGYEKISHNYMTKLTRYKKDFDFAYIHFFIRNNEIVMYGACANCDYQEQYELDNLQQAFNKLQNDLKELKEYENCRN